MVFCTSPAFLISLGVLVFIPEIFGIKFREAKVGLFHEGSGFWVDGNGSIGELTNTGKFILKVEDETGCIYFTQGNNSFAPSSGCAHQSSVMLKNHNPLEITHRWSLNSDGTIGNACDPTTRLVVNAEESKVELRKVDDCIGDLGGRIEFVVIEYE